MSYKIDVNKIDEIDEISEEIKTMSLTKEVAGVPQSDVTDITSMLDDLDLEEVVEATAETDVVEDAIIEDDVEEVDDLDLASTEVSDEELRDLEAVMDRQDAYENQESAVGSVDTSAADELKSSKSAKKAKKTKSVKAPSSPRAPRDLNSVPDEMFVMTGDPAKMSKDELSQARSDTMSAKPTQKKIAEKFDNLFQTLSVGRLPSVYVVGAFKLLDDQGNISRADILTMWKGSYNVGTAASQAGQIINLFQALQVMKKTGTGYELNPDSAIAVRLREAIKSSSAAA